MDFGACVEDGLIAQLVDRLARLIMRLQRASESKRMVRVNATEPVMPATNAPSTGSSGAFIQAEADAVGEGAMEAQ